MRIVKKLLIVLGVFVVIVVLAATVISVSFGDQIRQAAIDALNRQLATKVIVKGPIGFSLFRHFPDASVNFNGVTIEESLPQKKPFVQAGEISMLFSIWSFFGRSYDVRQVEIQKGSVNIHITSDGEDNYSIFKKSNSASSDFHLQIENALLDSMDVLYDDDQINHHYSFHIHRCSLSGNFSAEQFMLNIQSDLLCHHLLIDSIDYLNEKALNISGNLLVNLDRQLFTFNHFKLTAENNDFFIDGSIQSQNDGSAFNLQLTGNDLKPENMLALLPQKYQPNIQSISSGGDLSFAGKISGNNTHQENPSIAFHFSLKNGSLSSRKQPGSIDAINLEADFDNGANHSVNASSLAVNSFTATISGNALDGNLLIQDFNDPQLTVSLNGEADLKQLLPFLPSTWISDASGTLIFHQVYYHGNAAAWEHPSAQNLVHAGGEFTLKNVSITLPDIAMQHINGSLTFSNNNVEIPSLQVTAGNSDLQLNGSISNLIPFLFAQFGSDKHFIPQLGMTMQLTSNHLNWNDFTKGSASAEAIDTTAFYGILPVFYRIAGSVKGTISDFNYDHFHAANIRGEAYFVNNHIYLNNISMNAEKGSTSFNGDLDMSDHYHNHLQMTASLQQLDISQLFEEFQDFGQTTLTHKNLSGELTAQVSLKSSWNGERLNLNTLEALADISVENGELKNFSPMMALATFIRLNDLRDIHFSKLSNEIEIKNEFVYIPVMNIFSNALNVQLSGTHSFSNVIDYSVQLNLLKLLSEKFSKSQAIPKNAGDESTEGFLNLYLTMKGDASNPRIQYDKLAVKQKIESDLAEEKQNLKGTLNKEFDASERNEQAVKDWKSPADPQYMQFEGDSASVQKPDSLPPKKPFSGLKKLFQPKPPKQ